VAYRLGGGRSIRLSYEGRTTQGTRAVRRSAGRRRFLLPADVRECARSLRPNGVQGGADDLCSPGVGTWHEVRVDAKGRRWVPMTQAGCDDGDRLARVEQNRRLEFPRFSGHRGCGDRDHAAGALWAALA
jgi:hypothetical protein